MPVGRPLQPVPEHGTRERYQHRRMPCRCTVCRRANADYQAVYRASSLPPAIPRGWVQLEIPRAAYEHVGR